MKALRSKNLMGLLFAFILSIPMVSIISRVIYVQSNKNAKDSYYGETINEETFNRYSFSQLEVNEDYYLTNDLITQLNTQQYTDTYFVVDNLKIDNVEKDNTNRLRFYYTNSYAVIQLYNNTTATGESYNLVNNSYTFEFTYLGYIGDTTVLSVFDNMIYTISYNKDSYLDNVFDYSISKLVDENNFGQLNFFEWFNNFLLNDSQNNLLYVRFANWYMNYAMLVSLMYILFLCLMWFVNFSRKLLERGMNYDW